MLGQREEQKRRTRARILAAARKLFEDPGYDATTIRMIAAEAGVAVGSVFTTFESKEDVLIAITGEVLDQLAEDMAKTFDAIGGTAREKAKIFFAEAFIALQERLPLLMVHLGLAWRWSRTVEAERKVQLTKVFKIMVDALSEGVRSGELPADTDIPFLTDILADIFIRNFRRAWFRQLDARALAALSARQIDLVFDGACGRRPG
jgi:AcrR family transcriptional regulator